MRACLMRALVRTDTKPGDKLYHRARLCGCNVSVHCPCNISPLFRRACGDQIALAHRPANGLDILSQHHGGYAHHAALPPIFRAALKGSGRAILASAKLYNSTATPYCQWHLPSKAGICNKHNAPDCARDNRNTAVKRQSDGLFLKPIYVV